MKTGKIDWRFHNDKMQSWAVGREDHRIMVWGGWFKTEAILDVFECQLE